MAIQTDLLTANLSSSSQDRWLSCAIPQSILNVNAGPGYQVQSSPGTTVVVGKSIGPNLSLVHMHRNFQADENEILFGSFDTPVGEFRCCQETGPSEVFFSGIIDGKYCYQEIEFDRIAYSDPVLTVYEAHQRIYNVETNATKLSVDAYYYRWANHPVSTLEVGVVSSNPSIDAWKADIQDLRIRIVEADEAICRWRNWQQVELGAASNELLLVSGTDYLPDGQGLPGYVIDFIQKDAAPQSTTAYEGISGGAAYFCVSPEQLQGKFFTLGGLPSSFQADQTPARGYGLSATQEMLSYWDSILTTTSNRWEDPERLGGCSENPGRPGEQPDFGAGVPNYVLAAESYAPLGLDMAYAGAMREWIRAAAHYREADGRRIDLADHPDLHFWGERRHRDTNYSPDRLGQSHYWMPGGNEAHGMNARNLEHFTANQITGTYALTGSFLLRERLNELGSALARCWTGYESGDYTYMYMQVIADGHRFDGRCASTAARIHWATGNEDALSAMRQRIKARVQYPYERFGWWSWGGILRDQMPYDNDIFVLNVDFASGGYFGGEPWWGPWQVGLAIYGLEQTRIESGDPAWNSPYGYYENPWGAVLAKLCRSWIRHGWIYDVTNNYYFCAKAIKWDYINDDYWTGFTRPVPDSRYDPNETLEEAEWIKDARGTAYNQWNWAGAKIALNYLTDEADISKCQNILDQLRNGWIALPNTGFLADTFQVNQRYGVAQNGQY